MAEMVIARNPAADSTLGYLLCLPVGDGLLFRTSGTWPRTKALYCHPVDLDEWPAGDDLEIVERARLKSCARRGAAIDVVVDRGRENRPPVVHPRSRPGHGVLAVAPHAQAGPPAGAHPDRARRRHRLTASPSSRSGGRRSPSSTPRPGPSPRSGPTTAEVRAWARRHEIPVPDRGRLRPEIWQRYRDADKD